MKETILGSSICNECGGTKVLVIKRDLYAKQGLISSRCLKCGFQEDEWLFGDNPEYLEHLAQTYGVSVEQIKQALKPYCTIPTQIQQTIIQQLKALNPYFERLYGVKAILWRDDGRTVRLHTQNNNITINIDITYHRIPDAYEINAYKIEGIEAKPLTCIKEVLFPSLDETIHQLLNKYADVPLRYL